MSTLYSKCLGNHKVHSRSHSKPFPTTNKVNRISISRSTSHQPYVGRILINVLSDAGVCTRVNQLDRWLFVGNFGYKLVKIFTINFIIFSLFILPLHVIFEQHLIQALNLLCIFLLFAALGCVCVCVCVCVRVSSRSFSFCAKLSLAIALLN